MRTERHREKDALIIRVLERRLDAAVAEEFGSVASDIAEKNIQAIIIDLSRVDYIDSAGIGAIIGMYRELARDRQVVLSGPRDQTLSLFRLARLDNVIHIYPTEGDALAAVRQQPSAPVVAPAPT